MALGFSLQTLELLHNSLSGIIGESIADLTLLTSLDLSYNRLTGWYDSGLFDILLSQ